MGVNTKFLSNASYTADDVNRAFAVLTTQGVSLFVDTGTTLTDLDTAISNISTSGITQDGLNACKVVLDGSTYKVSPGTCICPSGAMITVDSDGYTLNITSGAVNYVYVCHNKITDTVDIIAADTAGGNDAVSLATINADGTITDTRTYAKAKIQTNGGNLFTSLSITGLSKNAYKEIETGRTDFTRVILYGYRGDNDASMVCTVSTDSENPSAVYWRNASNVGGNIYLYKSGSKLYIKSWQSGFDGEVC